MNMRLTLLATFNTIPPFVRSFLKKAVIIFVIWKLLYHLLLFPSRFPDRQLTRLTAASTSFLYKQLLHQPWVFYSDSKDPKSRMSVLYINNRRAIAIGDACNGLELYVLFIAFLFCIRTNIKRQIAFTLAGIAVIFVTNGFRCFGLAWLFLHHYSWANFAHHYLFKMVIYSLMFCGWILYSKKTFRYAF
jgi:exosortase/archaeosortase family protein